MKVLVKVKFITVVVLS